MSKKKEILNQIWEFIFEHVYELNSYDVDYLQNLFDALEAEIKNEALLEMITEDTDNILRDEEDLVITEEWDL